MRFMFLEVAITALVKIALLVGGLMTAAAYLVLLERWIAAWTQDRIGPNRVGIPLTNIRLFGLGQPLADGVKMILKEQFTPAHVNRRLFLLAPIFTLAVSLVGFAVVPFGSLVPPLGSWNKGQPIPLVVVPGFDVALIFAFALSSMAVYGVILGGWASNNKYSFLGALRTSAQLIAYELPLGLGLLGVVLASGSLRLDEIISMQARTGVWYALVQPLGFIVFVIAAFAEAARLPFDLPECEQELVGGYHTEYAGLKLLLFLVAEFLHMIRASFLIVILFLGGWHCPWLTGSEENVGWVGALLRIAVLQAKVLAVVFFFMLVRWSWPRFRFDQLMSLAWKVMLPLGMVNFVAVAIFEELKLSYPGWSAEVGFAVAAWIVCALGWIAVAWFGPLITDNRPRLDLHHFEIDPQV